MIYLDHHATTPVDPEVLKAMLPFFEDDFGNPSSKHSFGWSAEKAVENARRQVASLIGAQSREITFTSGATESNNTVLFGIAEGYKDKGQHIVVSNIEHKSILNVCEELSRRGFEITYLPVDQKGRINPDLLAASLRPETVLVSVQMANNEIGTIQPLKEIGELTKAKKIFFHTDAAQAVSTLKIDVNELGVDLLSLSAHKIYGPKGIGALYVRNTNPRIKLKPLIFGSGHERGLRSGTLNVPGIVGLGKACELIEKNRVLDFEKLSHLRDFLAKELQQNLRVKINGDPQNKLPHNLSVTFEDIEDINEFLKKLSNIAVSTGSACSSAQIDPSHVLMAIGLSDKQANQTLRFGLGRKTTLDAIKSASAQILAAL